MVELYTHQRVSRDFLAQRKVGFLLDHMGLGKSLSAVAAADKIGAKRILVLTPAIVRVHFGREFRRFSPERNIQVVEKGSEPITGDVVIISYALTRKVHVWRRLMARFWDLLIIDEGQQLKTYSSKQTKAVLGKDGLYTRANRVWVLSGSLLPHSRCEEAFPYFRALLGETRSFWAFREHFGVLRETPWGVQHVRNKNVDEFKAAVEPYTLRRRAQDVIGLPRLRYGVIPVRAGEIAPQDVPEELHAAVASGDDNAILKAIERAAGDALARLRRLTGEAKIGPTVEVLTQELADNPKHQIVVLGWHKAVLRAVAEGVDKFGACLLTGDTPPRRRQQMIDAFQAGQARVFVAQIQAGGLGIDLTAAGDVVLVEQSWNPADNAQAIARIVRPTQKRPSVLARFVTLAGSIDEAVTGVLLRKAAEGRALELAA